MYKKQKFIKAMIAARTRHGWTLREMSEKIKTVSYATIYRIEAGSDMVTLNNFLSICKCLELDPKNYI